MEKPDPPRGWNGVESVTCSFHLELEKIPEGQRKNKVFKLSSDVLKPKEGSDGHLEGRWLPNPWRLISTKKQVIQVKD